MNELAISTIELFAGVGMLGEGVQAGLAYMGIKNRAVCYVEREAYAASVLVARMEEGSLDEAPVWSDVCTFGASAWRGKVDCIVAGFPCQDLSVAGRRIGLDGKRSGLFFEVVRIATDSGAWLIVLENVAGISSAPATVVDEAEGELDERAAARVVGELADLGWNSEWIVISASDVGASHGRARWFCLAWRMDDAAWHVGDGSEEWESGSGRGVCEAGDELGDTGLQYGDVQQREVRTEHSGTGDAMEFAARIGRQERWSEPAGQQGRSDVAEHGGAMADASSPRCSGRQDTGAGASDAGARSRSVESERGCSILADTSSAGLQRRGGGNGLNETGREKQNGSISECRGLFAPGPSDPRWAGILDRFPEVAPALEPTFRSVVNGLAFDMGDSRAARLKCVGNGVVALDAATALVILARRAGIFG